MRCIILLILLSTALFTPSVAWEMRGNIYPTDDGIIQWNADNFAGLDPRGSEAIEFNISGQQLGTGAAGYQSGIQNIPFRHKAWGSYSALSFLGRQYFIGYPESSQISEPVNLFAQEYRLGKVIMDNDDSYTLEGQQPLSLKDGYNLKFSDAEDGVKVSLYNGSKLVDSQVLQPPADYIYEGSIANQNATLIAVAVKANVKLEPESYYTIKGIFQLSEETDLIEPGMKYGSMQVDSLSESGIKLINPEVISLSKGQDLELMDGFRIKTSSINASSERLYIYRNATESDLPEIRSEIATGDFSWTPQNFAGFYYDVDEDLGAESLATTLYDNKLEEPNGVAYFTTAQQKEFEFKDWGHYNTLAFLGESYVASYGEDSLLSRSSVESYLLSSEKLGRVLMDSGELRIIENGANLTLEDGLEARIYVDQSCSKALIEIYGGGELIDRDYIDLPNTYIYKKGLEGIDEIAILAIHIADPKCASKKSCLVDGIFQMSEELVDVSADHPFGNMRIASVTSDSITMDNKDRTIFLSKNMDTVLAGDYHIKAIDGDSLRYYIFKPIST
jgi:S-layer protein (TIGR01567 family)